MIEQPKKPSSTRFEVHQGHQAELKHQGMPHVPRDAYELMTYRYPDQMLPLEETLKIYQNHSLDELEAKGLPQERLQRIAFFAVYSAHHQHYRGTSHANEPIPELAERIANNILKSRLDRLAGVEPPPVEPSKARSMAPAMTEFMRRMLGLGPS